MTLVQWPLAKGFPQGRHGMVAAKHPLAAQAGVEILRQGGSAADSAIATSFASGVVEPYMSGIGGGGLAVYHPAGGAPRALHFGMRAPVSAAEDMYQIMPGESDSDLFGWPRTAGDANVFGPKSVGVPGQVGGLHRLWQMGGRLPWRDLLAPAIALAAGGFPVDWLTSLWTLDGHDLLMRNEAARSTFLPRGRAPVPDMGLGAEVLRQPHLARTLAAIAEDAHPPRGVPGGDTMATSLMEAVDGRFTVEEALSQGPDEDESISLSLWGVEVHLVPWATGGPTVLEWLGIVEELNPLADDANPDFWWAIVKAGDAAFADRLARLGDPAYVPFPTEILEESYHRQTAEAIRAGEVAPVPVQRSAGSTSHLSVVDEQGSVVSITQTLLSRWGSGIVTKDTGILLNNGMMWFDPEPGHANSIQGGKAPLANMCPILVTRDRQALLTFGASGGRKILPALVQILVRVVLLGQSLAEAMAAPRLELAGGEILADVRFGTAFCEALEPRVGRPVRLREPALGASPWASPVGLIRQEDGSWTGGADLFTQACVAEA